MELYRRNLQLLFVVYVAFVHAFERACCSTLPGSCIAAGHTACCNGDVEDCAGDSGQCFCDPVCQEYEDCCADLSAICSEATGISQQSSLVMLPNSVTYSTATVHWICLLVGVSSPGSGFQTDDSDLVTALTTMTYTISYYSKENVSDVLTVSGVGNSAEVHSTLLTNLIPQTRYFYYVSINSELGNLQSKVDTFVTLDCPVVQQLRIEVVKPSTVRVLWPTMQLPQSAQIVHYTVYYGQDETVHELSQEFSARYNYGEIAGLHAGAHYNFSLSVTISDVDGSVLKGNRSSISTNFIPAMSLFQLKAGPFQACHLWDEATEAATMEEFRSGVLETIGNSCNCQFPSNNIYQEVVFCEVGNTNPATAHAVYRAIIFSTPNLSTDELLAMIRRWALAAPVLRTQQLRLQLTLDSSCPVSIARMSEQLCSVCRDCNRVAPEEFSTSFNNGSAVVEDCVSLPIVIAALLAELLFCAVLMMVGVVITLLATRSSKNSGSSTHLVRHREPAASNLYTTHPEPVSAVNQAARNSTSEELQ